MTPEMHPQRWGDPTAAVDLPATARGLVELAFGGIRDTSAPARELPDLPHAGRGPARRAAGGRRAPEHVLTDTATRALRTRGKSTPDLLRARAGDLTDAPDVVVRPADQGEVEALVAFAVEHHLALVPFGGGTSVTGGLVARREGFAGVVSLDLGRLDRLVAVDPVSMTATLEPGVRGPRAEALLAEHGLTLGHFPQSFEYASIGGFAATRSSGQSSAGYGRFDALVVGLTVVTPSGVLTLGSAPASAAGPDLRQLVLGSEGTLGVITSVTVRVRRLPAAQGVRRVALAVVRRRVRRDAHPRAGRAAAHRHPALRRDRDRDQPRRPRLDRRRRGRGLPDGRRPRGRAGRGGRSGGPPSAAVLTGLGGVDLGEEPGRAWEHGRFHAPYLRDSLLDVGVLVETLETATFWSRRQEVYDAVRAALVGALGEGALVLCHVSHVYETGCSLYFTVAVRQGEDPIAQWAAAKAAASDAMVAAGATITHHHAVGTDHKPWLAQEIGPVGVQVLRAVKDSLDPTGVLNPGVLVP